MPGLLVPILAQAITFSAGDRTGVRSRLSEDELSYDAETRPDASLQLRTRRTAWTLGYSVSISALSIGEPEYELVVFHNVSASASFRFRRTFVTIEQTAGYGEQNFRLAPLATPAPDLPPEDPPDPPPGAPDPPPEPPPDPPETPPDSARAVDTLVRYGTTGTTASVAHVLSRRWSLSESVGYSVGGGLDATSRAVYPIQHAVFAGAGVTHALTRVDGLFTGVDARAVDTPTTRARALIVSARQNWSHRYSRSVSGGVGAGAAYTISRDGDGTQDESVTPVADASLTHSRRRQGARLSTTVAAGVTAVVDRTTGLVDERLLWSLSFSRERGRLTLVAAIAGARSLDPDAASSLTSISASGGAILGLSREWSADAGVSTVWQLFGEGDAPPPVYAASIGITYRMTPLAL